MCYLNTETIVLKTDLYSERNDIKTGYLKTVCMLVPILRENFLWWIQWHELHQSVLSVWVEFELIFFPVYIFYIFCSYYESFSVIQKSNIKVASLA